MGEEERNGESKQRRECIKERGREEDGERIVLTHCIDISLIKAA